MEITWNVNLEDPGTQPPLPSGDDTIGALTEPGEGGIATTATDITGGDPNGHWQILNGRLCPTVDGHVSGMPDSPYTLVLTGAADLEVHTVANRRDVATTDELQATYPGQLNAASEGQIVGLRDGTYDLGHVLFYNAWNNSGLVDFVTWDSISQDPDAVTIENFNGGRQREWPLQDGGDKYLRVMRCTIPFEQPQDLPSSPGTGTANKMGQFDARNGGYFEVIGCKLDGGIKPWAMAATFLDRPLREFAVMIGHHAHNLRLEGCDCRGYVSGMLIEYSSAIVCDNNTFREMWGDGIQINSRNNECNRIVFSRNVLQDFTGTYAYLHQDTFVQSYGLRNVTGLHVYGNLYFPGPKYYECGPTTPGPVNAVDPDTAAANYITADRTLVNVRRQYEVVATGSPVTITLPQQDAEICVARRPESTADVIVAAAAGDTIMGGASVTLSDTGKFWFAGTRSGGAWTEAGAGGFGPVMQQFILQMDNDSLRFRDVRVFCNIAYTHNVNSGSIGSGGGTGSCGDISHYNNSYIEQRPRDNNGDGQVDNSDGIANGQATVRMSGNDDAFSYRDITSVWSDLGPHGTPKYSKQLAYNFRDSADQARIWADRTGAADDEIQPDTYLEAITKALLDPGGEGIDGPEVYGAIGTDTDDGPWDWDVGGFNMSYAAPLPQVTGASPVPPGGTGIPRTGALHLQFDRPLYLEQRGLIHIRDAGGGQIRHTFDMATDYEFAAVSGSSDGSPGKAHRESDRIVLNHGGTLPAATTLEIQVVGDALRSLYHQDMSGVLMEFTTA
jgi:hypothetical protein